MSDPAGPDRGRQTAEDPHDGSEYEALFRDPVVPAPPVPPRPWWRWRWGGAAHREDAASDLSLEIVHPDPAPEQPIGPALPAVEEKAEPVATEQAQAFTPRRPKRKRATTRKAIATPDPATAPAPAPVEPPAPEPFAVPEIVATPEPAPRIIPELPEEDLPTGRPGPYFDPATEIPVYTDEQIEAQAGPPPRRRRFVATVLLVVAALAAFGTGLFMFNNLIMPRFIHSTAEVKVPDLGNLNYDQAEIALKPLGLVLSRAGERFDPAVPRGFILSQDPPPETPVRGRKRVMVVVSLGEEFSSVPSLFGESLRSARSLLQRSGLRVTGITRAPSDEVGEGLIAGTDPPAEAVLPRNAVVALLVSAGTEQEQYVMPDLVGREISGVRRHLESLGFRVITPPAAPSVGAIVYQDPAAGSRISLDTPISLQATGRIIR